MVTVNDAVCCVRCIELSVAVKQQYTDNINWIRQAEQHNLVSAIIIIQSLLIIIHVYPSVCLSVR